MHSCRKQQEALSIFFLSMNRLTKHRITFILCSLTLCSCVCVCVPTHCVRICYTFQPPFRDIAMYLYIYTYTLDPVSVMRTSRACVCVCICRLAWIGHGRLRVAGSWFIAKSQPVIFLDYHGPIFPCRRHRRRCVSVCPRFRTLFSRRRAPRLSTRTTP